MVNERLDAQLHVLSASINEKHYTNKIQLQARIKLYHLQDLREPVKKIEQVS